jgi:hypothetical protein
MAPPVEMFKAPMEKLIPQKRPPPQSGRGIVNAEEKMLKGE